MSDELNSSCETLKTTRLECPSLSPAIFKLICSIFISIFYYLPLWRSILQKLEPVSLEAHIFVVALILLLSLSLFILFTVLSHHILAKPIIIAVLILSSVLLYLQCLSANLNQDLFSNALYTNINGIFTLISIKLILYVALLGVLPSFVIIKVNIASEGLLRSAFKHALIISIGCATTITLIYFDLPLINDFYQSISTSIFVLPTK